MSTSPFQVTPDSAATAHPRPLLFWCLYIVLSLIAIGFLMPVCHDFEMIVPGGYLLSTLAAAYTPPRSRTVSRSIILVLIGAVLPFVAALLLIAVSMLIGHRL